MINKYSNVILSLILLIFSMGSHAVHTSVLQRLHELKGFCIIPDFQQKNDDGSNSGGVEAASIAPAEEFDTPPSAMSSFKRAAGKTAAGIAGENKLSEKEIDCFGYLQVPTIIKGLTVFQASKQPQSPIKKSDACHNYYYLKQTRDGESFCPMLVSCPYQLPRIGRQQGTKTETMTIGVFPTYVSKKEAPLEAFLNDQLLVGIESFKRGSDVFNYYFDSRSDQFKFKLAVDTGSEIDLTGETADPSDKKLLSVHHSDLVIIRTLKSKEDPNDKNPKKPHSINFIRVIKKKVSDASEAQWFVQQTTFHVSLYGWANPFISDSGTCVCADEQTDILMYACLTRGPQKTYKKLAVTFSLKHLEFYGAGASARVACILGRKPHSADMQPLTILPHDLSNLDAMQASLYDCYPGAPADFGLMKCKWPTQHEMDTLSTNIEQLTPYPAPTEREEESI